MKRRSTITGVVAAFGFVAGVVVPYAATCGLSASAETASTDCYYINSNQIVMTKDEYDLLHNIGFDDYEVENMTESKFNKLMGMEFITTQKEVQIGYSSVDGNSNDTNISNLSGYDLQTRITSSTPYRSFETHGTDKVMYTSISFAKNNFGYKVFVKQNVYWQNDPLPTERMSEISAIHFKDSLCVADNGHGYQDVEMHLRYQKYSNDVDFVNIDNKYTGYDLNKYVYSYKLGDYVAFRTFLPWGENDKHFVVTLEVTFDTEIDNLTRTEIQSFYAHQTKGESIVNDTWSIDFTIWTPAIGVSVAFESEEAKPAFNDTMFRSINILLDDTWLSRC